MSLISEEVRKKLWGLWQIRGMGTLYLVGGAVRDLLLGRGVQDYDLLISGTSAIPFAQKGGRKTRGTFVLLDSDWDTARIVYPSFFLTWLEAEQRVWRRI